MGVQLAWERAQARKGLGLSSGGDEQTGCREMASRVLEAPERQWVLARHLGGHLS